MTTHRACSSEDDYVGAAFSGRGLLLILRSDCPDPNLVVDDPRWVGWRGTAAHRWGSG
ncbi:hypothetical protein ACIP98_31730 [Streptomyces sp. NPDC088354]|uniref:hypothetical protein n=1 Tax=unclassified Streptomyces TaxID=2593676 RepID=UPI0029B8882D|nr:hypothetical protein [Streptomyces sp. MI02-7b]MDX3076645.1 hypothetical protein [Streptomyces sp. MI02-7b]